MRATKDNNRSNILVVDDEQHICDIIVEALSAENYAIVALTDPQLALKHIEENPVDLVLTDLVIGDYSGVQILETTLANHSDAVVILMTAYPTLETAIEVLKKGAYDFLIKPFKLDILTATVKRSLKHQRIMRENLSLKGQVEFLKIFTASQTGIEIEKLLKLVVSACRRELQAQAAGLIEIDPDTKEPLRKICDCQEDKYSLSVLDEDSLTQFAYTRSTKPIIHSNADSKEGMAGVKIFISQPIFIRHKLHGVINLLILSRFGRITPGQVDVLALLTNAAASAIVNQRLYQNLQESYLQAIRALANAIEARDKYTAGHTDHVFKLAEQVAKQMGWDKMQMNHLRMGCTLHDIGKIGVPDLILNKAAALDEHEQRLMRCHPEVGLKIIEGINLFKPAVPYIIAHHERYDGQGYPQRLKGEEIPIEGRLLAVVDAFDAIMAKRPYRDGANLQKAVSELISNRGRQFDPKIVDAFVEIISRGEIDFREMYGRNEDTGFLKELPVSEKAPA
ncbi:MAG: HD domain-containing phosphohydrolase [Candidatus Zixiibacteriota bacterium]